MKEKEKENPDAGGLAERFTADGCMLDNISEEELMRFVLDSCIKRKDRSREAESRLISRMGSIDRLIFAPPEELTGSGVMTKSEAERLRIISGFMTFAESEKLGRNIRADDENKVKRYLSVLYLPHFCEAVYIIPVIKKKLGTPYLLSTGTDMSVNIDAEKILSLLRSFPGCKEFIMSHSHPNDTAEPSEEDCTVTTRLFGYLFSCGFTLLAHYVAGRDGVKKVPFDSNPLRYFFGGE